MAATFTLLSILFLCDRVFGGRFKNMVIPNDASGLNGKFNSPKVLQVQEDLVAGVLHKNPCEYFGTCAVNNQSQAPICYCDNLCKLFGDCCFDVGHMNDTDTVNNRNSKSNKMAQYLTCHIGIIVGNSNMDFGGYLISKCPTDYRVVEIVSKCENKDDIYPVTSFDGTPYKNVYCAYCHGVTDYDVWQMWFLYGKSCDFNSMANYNSSIPQKIRHIIKNNCSYIFKIPEHTSLRLCYRMISEKEGNTLCSAFQNPVYVYTKLYPVLYKNVYCYTNVSSISSGKCLFVESHPFYSRGFGELNMAGMLNIRPVIELYGKKLCAPNEVYEPTADVCIKSGCKHSKTSCHPEMVRNHMWSARTLLHFVTNYMDYNLFVRVAGFVFHSLPHEFYNFYVTKIPLIYHCGVNVTHPNETCCIIQGGYMIVNRVESTYEETFRLMSAVKGIEWKYTEIRDKMKIVAWHSSIVNYTYKDVCNITGSSTQYIVTSLQHIGDILQTFSFFNISRQNGDVPVSVNVTVSVFNDNDPVSKQLMVETWDIRYISGRIIAITDTWSVATILTYTSMGISCVALSFTIFVYKRFRLFNHSPGIITQNMMVSLLLAQLLFITGVGADYIYIFCLAVGIISHYLWLCVFSWISVFLFEVLRSLQSEVSVPSQTDECTTSTYLFLSGYGVPFLIVTLCALLDIFTNVNLGYTNHICFPTGFPANLFTFTLPVLVSIAINVTVLIKTVVYIRGQTDNEILKNARSLQSLIPTYLRLGVLCACPWIIGMLADLLDSDILRYTFIILAGSHGIFVSVTFLTTESVRAHFRNKNQNKHTTLGNDSSPLNSQRQGNTTKQTTSF